MTTQIKHRRGTTSEHSTFVGAEAEITVDTTKDTLVVHDGATAGGHELAKADGSNIAFGDNVKAKFGNSDDLQIWHDGANSYITDTSTGDLIIDSNGNAIRLKGTNGENMIVADTDASAKLFHNGAEKLATTSTGVDVTGTVTADRATIDGGTGYGVLEIGGVSGAYIDLKGPNTDDYDLRVVSHGNGGDIEASGTGNIGLKTNGSTKVTVEGSTGNVGIGTSSPTSTLDVAGTVSADGITSSNSLVIDNGQADGADIQLASTGYHSWFRDNSNGELRDFNNGKVFHRIAPNGDISFYEDTGTTPKFFWDASAESLGIGYTDPSLLGTVTLKQIADGKGLAVIDSAGINTLKVTNDSASCGLNINDAKPMTFVINSSERMRIDSSGNVGIGTSSPDNKLTVASGSDLTGVGDGVAFYGGSSNKQAAIESYNAGGYSGDLRFYTGNKSSASTTVAERMRITNSGNLLVGTTVANPAGSNSVGVGISSGSYGGFIGVTRDGNTPVEINRKTSDGNLITLRKDGSTVGSIGAEGGDLVIGTGTNCGLQFNDGNSAIRPFNMAGNNSVDAAVSLGISTRRFKDLYLSGGVYLGGTGAANKLDDYEEGTWTPTAAAGLDAISTYYARYTKIGREVHIAFNGILNGGGTVTQVQIGGLPFTPNNEGRGDCVPWIDHASFGSNYTPHCAIFPAYTTKIAFYATSSTSNANQIGIQGNHLGNSSEVQINITYLTDA